LEHKKIKNNEENTIICGDTNMRQDEKNKLFAEYKNFFYNGEILLKNKEEKAKYYTWNLDFFQATYCVAKFDVFFIGNHFHCNKFHICDEFLNNNDKFFLSDHRALLLEFYLP